MLNEQEKSMRCDSHSNIKKIFWTPILVGAFTAIGITFLLSLFSIAIGLSAFTMSNEGLITVAMGGLIGTLLGIIVTMFTAGWVSGYLGRSCHAHPNLGIIYGFTTWCMALILTGLISMHLTRYVYVYSNFVTHPTTMNAMPLKPHANPAMLQTAPKDVATIPGKNLAMDAFIIFVLFFAGAFSSCFGGHCGINHYCQEEEKENRKF